MATRGRLFAGTSGFAYPSWKPAFYPQKLPASRFLEHYSGRLDCVEINYTFRRTPSESTLENWIRATPDGFAFAIKAHQRITHTLRLRDAGDAARDFLRAVEPLRAAGRLGPVLFQLPPGLHADRDRLASFLAGLPEEGRFAFEFRHESWFTEETYALLRERDAALCVAEAEALAVPDVATASFCYYRYRRPDYGEADMSRIAVRAGDLLAQGRDVYAVFKHEDDPQGALHAERLLAAVT
jgi:uncharacterized protein YecE (DUF72 family)